MKDNLLLVINNMASNYDKNDFVRKSFNHFYKCTEANYFNSKLVIIDDSGDKISDYDFYSYYKDFDRFPNVQILSNRVNQNLLRSRFRIFDIIPETELNNTWIRYLDSGDRSYNSESFQFDLMMKMNDKSADWYIFPQGILSDYESHRYSLDSFYFTCFGDSKDKKRIIESTLSAFNACPMWNKVFKASLLKKVANDIKLYNNGELPYLFHTEDFLINCIYAFYTDSVATINKVHVLYDNESGDSASRIVSKDYYDNMKNQVEIVRKTLYDFYDTYDIINKDVTHYYIDKKLDHWIDRFKVK